jgi:hypothetical protein
MIECCEQRASNATRSAISRNKSRRTMLWKLLCYCQLVLSNDWLRGCCQSKLKVNKLETFRFLIAVVKINLINRSRYWFSFCNQVFSNLQKKVENASFHFSCWFWSHSECIDVERECQWQLLHLSGAVHDGKYFEEAAMRTLFSYGLSSRMVFVWNLLSILSASNANSLWAAWRY